MADVEALKRKTENKTPCLLDWFVEQPIDSHSLIEQFERHGKKASLSLHKSDRLATFVEQALESTEPLTLLWTAKEV